MDYFVDNNSNHLLIILKVVAKEIVSDIHLLSNIMLTSKGRDKVFSFFQYLAELYIKTMTSSVVYRSNAKKGLINSVNMAKMIKNNISNGRKVFKFLKFFDEYNSLKAVILDSNVKNKLQDTIIKFLTILQKFCGVFYYMFDNMVWISHMGAINKDIIENKLGWRQVKDLFAFLKNVCESSKSLIKY